MGNSSFIPTHYIPLQEQELEALLNSASHVPIEINTQETQESPIRTVVVAAEIHVDPRTSSPVINLEDNQRQDSISPTTVTEPEPPAAGTTHTGPFNVFLFRKDLKNIGKIEWDQISDFLLLKQLETGLIIDLSKSRFNSMRRSHQLTTSNETDAIKVSAFLQEHLDRNTYGVFAPNTSSELDQNNNRVITYLPKNLATVVDAGLLTQLMRAGTSSFSHPIEYHISLPAPPKTMDNGRIAVIYEVTEDFMGYLKSNNLRIHLVGKTQKFKIIGQLKNTAEMEHNLGSINLG